MWTPEVWSVLQRYSFHQNQLTCKNPISEEPKPVSRASTLNFTPPAFTTPPSTLPSQLPTVLYSAEAFTYLAMSLSCLSSRNLSRLPLTHITPFSGRSSPAPLALLWRTRNAAGEECVSTGAAILLWHCMNWSVLEQVNTIQCSTPIVLSFSVLTKYFTSEHHQLETAYYLTMKPNCTKYKQNITFFLNPK